jgi:hypothetical protein
LSTVCICHLLLVIHRLIMLRLGWFYSVSPIKEFVTEVLDETVDRTEVKSSIKGFWLAFLQKLESRVQWLPQEIRYRYEPSRFKLENTRIQSKVYIRMGRGARTSRAKGNEYRKGNRAKGNDVRDKECSSAVMMRKRSES